MQAVTKAGILLACTLTLAGCDDREPLTPGGERPDVQTPAVPEPAVESPSPGPG